MKKRLGALVGLVIGLSGCAVGADHRPPDISVPNAFVPPLVQIAQKTAQRSGADLVEWWHSLRDPELNSLVRRAIESNLDLEIALTRIQAARTQELVVMGQALPSAGGTGGGGIGTGTNLTIGRASPLLRSAQNQPNLSRLSESGGFDAAWKSTSSENSGASLKRRLTIPKPSLRREIG
jgi:outer membrane protein TolC